MTEGGRTEGHDGVGSSRTTLTIYVVLVIVIAAGLIYYASTLGAGHVTSTIYPVPAGIRSDCSRAVEGDLNRFLARVPDGSTVMFPPGGCYGQDQTIVLRDRRRLVIDGQGSTFRRITPPNPTNPSVPHPGNANWRIVRGDTVTLLNMTVMGNYPGPPRGISPGQGQYTDQGVSIWGGLNDSIVNIVISNTDGEFVEIDPDVETARARYGGDYAKVAPSRNIVVDRLHGEHAARQCVAATSVDGLVISNSFVDDCQQNGIDIEIDTGGELARNIQVINNRFGGIYFSAISVPALSLPGFDGQVANVELRGNTMTRASDSCFPAILIGAGPAGRLDGLSIIGNTLLTMGDGVSLGNANIHGNIERNSVTRTAANTGCVNAKSDPPQPIPVRLSGSPVATAENMSSGFN